MHGNVISLFLLTLLMSGCGGGVHITEKPFGLENDSKKFSGQNEIKPLAILKNIHLEIGGVERTPAGEFLIRIRGKFGETDLFHEVSFNDPLPGIPHIKFNLTIKESEAQLPPLADRLLSGFTLGLIPLKGEYDCEMTLDAERSDGAKKEYSAKGRGTATAYLGLHNYNSVLNDLVATVNSNNFNSLMNQMIQDADFFRLERQPMYQKPSI